MPRHLDGIWANRPNRFYEPPSWRDRYTDKLKGAVPKISWWPLVSRFSSATRAVVSLVRPLAVIGIASVLIFGLMQPAFSQTVTLGRLIKPGNYLVAFLNSDELRPSGGFLGSFVIAHFDGTHIALDVETNIYKHDNAFLENHFIPLPKPFNEVWPDRSMSLTNANYKADFKESAQSILDYYEAEYGTRPDGVLGVTVLPVLDLMGMVGPVTLPQDNLTITQENFLHTLHQNIQVDYFKDPQNRLINEPKTIIADLVAALPSKIAQLPTKNLWRLIDGALAKKQLL
ncbi:DUF4012 domain-containing protein, partial [Candidatus Berkelbacteria bacterium]|nr:DUF4012 domain-containing protein [Candidatus Berkelbacteria bacterium]